MLIFFSRFFVLGCISYFFYGLVSGDASIMAFGLVLVITSVLIATIIDAIGKRSVVDREKITHQVRDASRVYYSHGNTSGEFGGEHRPGFQAPKRAG